MNETAVYFWLACGIVGAVIGSKKKQAIGGFICGILLGPIGVLIVILVPGPKTSTCPYCREEIKPNASVCKHCGSDLDDDDDEEDEEEQPRRRQR